jgi:hypothetical protein
MKILGLNRVELLVEDKDMDVIVKKFNDVFGFKLRDAHEVKGQNVRSSVDYDAGLEFVSPMNEKSPAYATLKEKGKGALLTTVWEVDDFDAARAWAKKKGLNVLLEFEGQGVKQLCLDPKEFFGFSVILMQRTK